MLKARTDNEIVNANDHCSFPRTKKQEKSSELPGDEQPKLTGVHTKENQSDKLQHTSKAVREAQNVKTCDAFGFRYDAGSAHVKHGVPMSEKGKIVWENYFSRSDASCLQGFRTSTLQDIIIEHGLPSSSRPELWLKWSGAKDKQEAEEKAGKTYLQYSKTTITRKVRQQIALDLPRTCPKHPAFAALPEASENTELQKSSTDSVCSEEDQRLKELEDELAGPGRACIGRVLRAYAARNPKLGYLQSMNFLTAVLYLVYEGKEDSMFWMLSTIVEDLLPGYFTPKLKQLLENVDAFGIVMKQMFPKVAAKLADHGLNISFRAPTWFLCMFFTSLKSEVVVRAWDLIFFNSKSCIQGAAGSAALCCLGLGVVDSVKEQILKASNISECAKALQQAGDFILDAKILMVKSFREITSVQSMARLLSSSYVKNALLATRLKLTQSTNTGKGHCRAPPASARRPKRKRDHRRSYSDGDIPFRSLSHEEAERPGPDKSPRTNARLMSKRRRIFLPTSNKNLPNEMMSSSSVRNAAGNVISSGLASFKKWLTPKKFASTHYHDRLSATARPEFFKHKNRLDFNNTNDVAQMMLIKPDSEQRKIINKRQQTPSVKSSALKRVQQQSAYKGQDSPRGLGLELKNCTTPAHIRRDSQVATRYTPPPAGPLITVVPPLHDDHNFAVKDLEDIL